MSNYIRNQYPPNPTKFVNAKEYDEMINELGMLRTAHDTIKAKKAISDAQHRADVYKQKAELAEQEIEILTIERDKALDRVSFLDKLVSAFMNSRESVCYMCPGKGK